MDLLAGFEILPIDDQIQTLKSVIDAFSSYFQPHPQNDLQEASKTALGAYLFISNVCNACELGALGLWSTLTACSVAQSNLVFALDLLVR